MYDLCWLIVLNSIAASFATIIGLGGFLDEKHLDQVSALK